MALATLEKYANDKSDVSYCAKQPLANISNLKQHKDHRRKAFSLVLPD